MALWLLGRAHNEVGDVAAACDALASARHVAAELGDDTLRAEISVSEAACLAARGDAQLAQDRLEEAAPHLSGGSLGRLLAQRGLLALHRGDLNTAERQLADAEPLLRAANDHAGLARLLANRSAVFAEVHRLGEARDDLLECRPLAEGEGLGMIAAGATHNLAYVQGRLGNYPDAIAEYERARSEYAALGLPRRLVAVLENDLCSTLSAAGLRQEAIEAGLRAVAASEEAGDMITLGDALLHVAEAELSDGRAAAADTAARARRVLADNGRGPLVALADFIALRSRLGESTVGEDTARLRSSIEELAAAGWTEEADEVRLVLARALAEGGGDSAEVLVLLEHVAEARRANAWHRRVTGWYAEALRRAHVGDGDVDRALKTGLRIVERHAAAFGASDLRSLVAHRMSELLDLGLEAALASGDDPRVAAWIDRSHAPSLRHRFVSRGGADDVAILLDRWRGAQHATGDDAAADVIELERQIRVASRSLLADRSTHVASPEHHATAATIVDVTVLGDDLVVAIKRPDSLVVRRDTCRSELAEAGRYADAALRRLARQTDWTTSADAARASLDDAAQVIDRLIFADDIDHGEPLIVIAEPALRQVPWGALPTLDDRWWALAPSASMLRARRSASADRGDVAAIAGPGLERSGHEVEAVAAIWGDRGRAIGGPEATTQRALRELERCGVVHFAAHGSFRSDSPTFSSIRLTDGPLTMYDLETLPAAPGTVVLAACDLGRMNIDGAVDVLSTASCLLHAGVDTVIAPLAIVDDDETVELMQAFHAGLVSSDDPVDALRVARRGALRAATPKALSCATAFVAIVAGVGAPVASDHATERQA